MEMASLCKSLAVKTLEQGICVLDPGTPLEQLGSTGGSVPRSLAGHVRYQHDATFRLMLM